MAKLKKMYDRYHDVKRDYHQAIKERFKPGETVHIDRGERLTPVEVNNVSDDRVLVYNHKTAKTYWIGVWWIKEYHQR